MKPNLTFSGGRDLERALADLPSSTSKGVARRALKQELKPVASMANAFWPGSSDDVFQISSRVRRSQLSDSGKSRDRSVLDLFVGAPGGPQGTPEAHLIEFGTGPRYTKNGAFRGSVAPQPMLQPAWDANKSGMLTGLGETLWQEIEKTVARRAKKAAKG
jgi:hypothetical protein